MNKKSFIYQETLEKMMAERKASLSGTRLTMLSDQTEYVITPAVKFIACETSEEDPLSLVGKVATYENLRKKGADIYVSSAIYEGHSFRIDQGYICTSSKE